MSKFTSALALSAFLALPGIALAGNVPQYTVQKGDKAYSELTDATVVSRENRQDWVAQTFIFADGTECINKYEGEGFPIGFDFRYAGQVHDQFVISPNGLLMLGKGKVVCAGNAGKGLVDEGYGVRNPFQISFMPTTNGFIEGTISYKTEGEAGDRVLTVEFKNMRLNEFQVARVNCARINFQIRLYEKDGKVQMAYKEIREPYSAHQGIYIGLHGWDTKDQILISGKSIDPSAKTNVVRGTEANMLKPETFLKWDDQDAGMEYENVWDFNPCNDTQAPANAPVDLTVVQQESSAIVSCKRAEGADATMILYSSEPFTDADMPVDGVAPQVTDAFGNLVTTIGKATVAYYSDGEEPSVTLNDIPAGQPLYVRAVSVNGYPAYNKENFAEKILVSTQLPPSSFKSDVTDEAVKLSWKSEYPVIVATTDLHSPYFMKVNEGSFGQPLSADVKVGDELPQIKVAGKDVSGGKVIYVGDASEFSFPVSEMTPNYLTYFKIWNVKDGVVSATGTQTYAVPNPTMPFEPRLEEWPMGVVLAGEWINSSDDYGFNPYEAAQYAYDRALRASCVEGVAVSLTSPVLPMASESELTFEWGLETQNNPYKPDGMDVILPEGMGDGMFWDPENGEKPQDVGFWVKAGANGDENQYFFTDEAIERGKFKAETVTIPAQKDGKGRISFSFRTVRTGNDLANYGPLASSMFLRYVKITQKGGSGVETILGTDGLAVTSGRGSIVINSDTDRAVEVYAVSGIKAADVKVAAGVPAVVELPAGIYIVNGNKIVVK